MSNIPSIAMIPSAYKSGKVYSVLPSDGSGDLNFARASEATRVNQNGLIELVDSNVPRLNYPMIDGVVSGCPSLLLEPQRTNLQLNSNQFDNATWSKTNSVVTANQIVSSDGGVNADKLDENTANSIHRVEGTRTVTAEDYTMSVFAKKGERNFILLYEDTASNGAYFNLNTGVVGTVTGVSATAKIENYGNGWYRCSLTYTQTGVVGRFRIAVAKQDNQPSYAGTTGYGIYIYGAQYEKGSYPTSYIPTNGATATRSAETCNNAGDANTFNDSEGVLFAEISALANDGSLRHITLGDGSSSNAVSIRYDNPNIITLYLNSGGASQASFTASVQTLSFNKCLIKYKENDFSAWVNGFQVGATDTVGIVFPSGTLDRINFDIGYGLQDFYGNTKQLQYFDTALNDTDLEELTSWTSFNEMATAQQYSIL